MVVPVSASRCAGWGGGGQALDQTWVGRVQDSGGGGAQQFLLKSSIRQVCQRRAQLCRRHPTTSTLWPHCCPSPREPTARPSSSLSVSSSTSTREPRPLLPGTEPLAKASVNEMIFAPRRRITVNLGQLEEGPEVLRLNYIHKKQGNRL